MSECICTPDAEDINGYLREDRSVHGDDYCPDCRTRLERLWYFVAEEGLKEIPTDWEKRCRRCTAASASRRGCAS